MTLTQALVEIRDKKILAREIREACLKNIRERDEEIGAFLWVNRDIKTEGEVAGPLAGLPIAIKDNILVRGLQATAGSQILSSYVAPFDATAVRKLREMGAFFSGKTNMDEFGMGSSTENSAFRPTKNPYDPTRVPGGSSGGSAAAVASEMCLAALGSDTGSSVRQPASFCGVVGLKPTYGAVSRHGLIALASSLDQIGPIARSVADVRLLFSIIAGQDRLDGTTLAPEPSSTSLPNSLSELTIGVPKEYFETEGLEVGVRSKVEEAIRWFGSEGARVKEVSLPTSPLSLATYYILMPAEASSNLARYDGMRYGPQHPSSELWEQYMQTRGEGFGPEPKRRSMIGAYVLSAGYYDAYYKTAKKAQAQITAEYATIFKEVDLLMAPTAPTTAFKFGERTKDPLAMYAADILTVPANIVGLPALSLPCGAVDGLPVGLQILGPWRREDRILWAAEKYEEAHTTL